MRKLRGREVQVQNNQPVYLPPYATDELPDAARWAGHFAFDTTLGQPVFSNGEAWVEAGSGGGGDFEFMLEPWDLGGVEPGTAHDEYGFGETGNAVDGEVVTLGNVTYRFVDEIETENDVLIGDNGNATLANLVDAINAGHELVTAQILHHDDFDTALISAKQYGTQGNSIVATTDSIDGWFDDGDGFLLNGSNVYDGFAGDVPRVAPGENTMYLAQPEEVLFDGLVDMFNSDLSPAFNILAITNDGEDNALHNETVSIGLHTYRWRGGGEGEELENANDVLIGESGVESLDNLMAAIKGGPDGPGAGVLYHELTDPNTYVGEVAKVQPYELQVYAVEPGTWGNSIAAAESMDNASWLFDNGFFDEGSDDFSDREGQAVRVNNSGTGFALDNVSNLYTLNLSAAADNSDTVSIAVADFLFHSHYRPEGAVTTDPFGSGLILEIPEGRPHVFTVENDQASQEDIVVTRGGNSVPVPPDCVYTFHADASDGLTVTSVYDRSP